MLVIVDVGTKRAASRLIFSNGIYLCIFSCNFNAKLNWNNHPTHTLCVGVCWSLHFSHFLRCRWAVPKVCSIIKFASLNYAVILQRLEMWVCVRLENLRLHAADRFVSSSQYRAGNISKKLFRSRWHFFGAVWLPFMVLTRSGTRAKSLAVDWRKSGRSIRILWDMKPIVAPGGKGRARSITMLTNCGRGLGTDDNIRTLNNLFAFLALLLYKWFL